MAAFCVHIEKRHQQTDSILVLNILCLDKLVVKWQCIIIIFQNSRLCIVILLPNSKIVAKNSIFYGKTEYLLNIEYNNLTKKI